VFNPKMIGDAIAAEAIHTVAIVIETRVLILCFAYLIGLVTAINL